MLRKSITYTDFDGNERTEVHYFNLTEAELTEMEMNESQLAKDGGITGGLSEKLERITNGGSGREILSTFKEILFMSYGEKSEDGKYFRKSAELSENFASTGAYTALFMEIMSDPDKASAFMNEVLPAKFRGGDQDKPSGLPAPKTQVTSREEPSASPNEPESGVTEAPKPTDEQIQAYLDSLGKKDDK